MIFGREEVESPNRTGETVTNMMTGALARTLRREEELGQELSLKNGQIVTLRLERDELKRTVELMDKNYQAQVKSLERTISMNATQIFALTESRNFYEAQCKEMTLRLARIRAALGDEILDQSGVPAEDVE